MSYCPHKECIWNLIKRTGVNVCPFPRCVLTQDELKQAFKNQSAQLHPKDKTGLNELQESGRYCPRLLYGQRHIKAGGTEHRPEVYRL